MRYFRYLAGVYILVWIIQRIPVETKQVNMKIIPQRPVVYKVSKIDQTTHKTAQVLTRSKRQSEHQVRYEHYHKHSADTLIRKPVLKPEYGTLFDHMGYIMHGVQRRYLFVAVDLPKVQDLLHDPPPPPDCLQLPRTDTGNQGDYIPPQNTPPPTPLHIEVCYNYVTVYQDIMNEIGKTKKDIEHIIKHQMPAMLPNKIIQTMKGPAVRLPDQTLWYSQYAKNITRQRRKRAFLAAAPFILSAVQTLGGLALKTANTVIAHKRTKQMMKAMQVLQANQNLMMDRTLLLENRTLTLTRTTFKSIQTLNERMDSYDESLDTLNDAFTEYLTNIQENAMSIRVLNKYITAYLQVLRKYQRFYTEYKLQISQFMTALDVLSTGHLTHPIVNPAKLARLEHKVASDIKAEHPHYAPVFENIYQYYADDQVTFTNTPDQLLLQIPIYFRLLAQKLLQLFSITTVPVPMDQDTIEGKSSKYTQIQPDYPFMAVNSEQYFPITQSQLGLCNKIGLVYYCENAFLQRHRSLPSCTTTLYYEPTSKEVVKHCNVTYYENVPLDPGLLDGGNQLVLSNLPRPWTLHCPPDDHPIPMKYSTYRIINRTEFCDCSLAAGPYFIGQTALDCDNNNMAEDGVFTTYYTYNQVLFDHLTMLYNITVAKLQDVSTLLTGIPQVSLPSVKFREQKQERKVLQTRTNETTCELKQLLRLMMTDDQEYYYRSNAAYEQSQHDFATFMKEAERWEIAHVVLSFLTTILWVGAILTCICHKRIVEAAILSLDELPSLYKVPRAEAATLPPFTLHTLPPFTLGPAEQPPTNKSGTIISYILWGIIILVTVIIITLLLYRKCKYRSSKWRILFPWYPRPTARRGLLSCDIFLEVVNLRTNMTTWAYFCTTTASPTQLRYIGNIRPDNIAIFHACGCLRYMSVNWDEIQLYVGENGDVIDIPKKGSLSLWTHNKLNAIETHDPHKIRLLGRALDHIFEIRKIEIPNTQPTAPRTTHHEAAAYGHHTAEPNPDIKIHHAIKHQSPAPPPYTGL